MTTNIPNTSYSSQKESLLIDFISLGPIRAGFTRRNPDLPENGNTALHVCQNPEDVMKMRKILEQHTLPLSRWTLPWQKHTSHIQEVTEADQSKGAVDVMTSIMDTDGLYTTAPNTLVGVFTADCLGILILDPAAPLVSAVHSGWKGTVQNILYKTIKELLEKNLIHPETVQIYFSPSIQKQSFEIGPDVKEQLLNSGKEIGLDYSDLITDTPGTDRSFADHQEMNVRVLKSFGIPGPNIHPSQWDTKTSDSCFSFRRDGSKTGEHLSFAYIVDENFRDKS